MRIQPVFPDGRRPHFVTEKVCFCTTKLRPYNDTVLCGCTISCSSNTTLCAVRRTVLVHLAPKYSQEAVYCTTLQDIPSPPAGSRRCRNYWVTHARLLTSRARQHCFHCGSRITSARRNDKCGRDSLVGIATRYGLDGPGIKFQ